MELNAGLSRKHMKATSNSWLSVPASVIEQTEKKITAEVGKNKNKKETKQKVRTLVRTWSMQLYIVYSGYSKKWENLRFGLILVSQYAL